MLLTLLLALTSATASSVGQAPLTQAGCYECPPKHTHPRHKYPKDNPLTKRERRRLTKRERHAIIASAHRRSHYKSVPPPTAKLRSMGIEPDSVSGCGVYSLEIYTENAVGWHIWYFKNTVHWCWQRGKVIVIQGPYAQVKIYDWAAFDGWEYQGLEDTAQYDYYHDKWVYSSYTQGKFVFCPPRIFCVSSKYPWMYQYTYGNGDSGSGGWGI